MRAMREAVEGAPREDSSVEAHGAKRPSELGHPNVPFPEQREQKTERNYSDGVTLEYAEQTIVLSLVCLRRPRFPLGGYVDPEVDVAARTVLAAPGPRGGH